MQKILSAVLCFVLLISCVTANAVNENVSELDFLKMVCDTAGVKPLIPMNVSSSVVGAEYIQGALGAGIVDAGMVAPEADITREEAVAMIVRGLIAMKNDLSAGADVRFADKDEISPEYLTYIEVAVANKVIEGVGRFEPKKLITKADAGEMIAMMKESYLRLPVLRGSGIRRIQFPVIENANVVKPSYIDERYKLVFNDDFDGEALDTAKWGYNYSWGHSHNHAAWCAEENVIVKDGILTLKGENRQHPDAKGKQGTFNNKKYDIIYTSGAVNTHYKFNFDYGYFEARMKMPKGKGMWPAWWMLKDGWPPEIDMLEVLCSKPKELHVNFHYGPAWNEHYSHEQVLNLGFDTSDEFHTYGFEWTPDYMRYYVDGVQVGHDFTNKNAIAQASGMYMILNLAIDGWDGRPDNTTVWPAEFKIDYVRAWQLNE
ncbi:MAG: family 16 glycosylhydrolase [Clostridia bacterium]|nr:family 16 glycosylhydrolase [Clostridia bacterium]